MSNYEYNETPSWVVDWINKIFTTANNIERIEEFYIWGSSYRDLSFIWNVITLTDAPAIGMSVSVDYFKEDLTPTPTSSDVTLWEIIDDVYSKIWQNRTWNNVYKEAQIKNHIVREFERIKNKKLLPNKTRSYSFNTSVWLTAKTYNSSYIEIWSNIKNIPSNWVAILSNSVLVEYTSYTDWKLISVPWVEYKPWSQVVVWYKIPSWVKKVSEVLIDGAPLEYADIREYSISSKYYTITTSSNWDKYIILPFFGNWEKIATVNYYPTQLLAAIDADIVDIESEYLEVLSYYALWKTYEDREDDRADRAERSYRNLLKEYRAYISNNTFWIRNRFKTLILPSYVKNK